VYYQLAPGIGVTGTGWFVSKLFELEDSECIQHGWITTTMWYLQILHIEKAVKDVWSAPIGAQVPLLKSPSSS